MPDSARPISQFHFFAVGSFHALRIIESHVGAASREFQRDRPADAPGGSGHDRGPFCKTLFFGQQLFTSSFSLRFEFVALYQSLDPAWKSEGRTRFPGTLLLL